MLNSDSIWPFYSNSTPITALGGSKVQLSSPTMTERSTPDTASTAGASPKAPPVASTPSPGLRGAAPPPPTPPPGPRPGLFSAQVRERSEGSRGEERPRRGAKAPSWNRSEDFTSGEEIDDYDEDDRNSDDDEDLTEFEDSESEAGEEIDSRIDLLSLIWIGEEACRLKTILSLLSGDSAPCVCGRVSSTCKRHVKQRRNNTTIRHPAGWYTRAIPSGGKSTYGFLDRVYLTKEKYDEIQRANRRGELEEITHEHLSGKPRAEEEEVAELLKDAESRPPRSSVGFNLNSSEPSEMDPINLTGTFEGSSSTRRTRDPPDLQSTRVRSVPKRNARSTGPRDRTRGEDRYEDPGDDDDTSGRNGPPDRSTHPHRGPPDGGGLGGGAGGGRDPDRGPYRPDKDPDGTTSRRLNERLERRRQEENRRREEEDRRRAAEDLRRREEDHLRQEEEYHRLQEEDRRRRLRHSSYVANPPPPAPAPAHYGASSAPYGGPAAAPAAYPAPPPAPVYYAPPPVAGYPSTAYARPPPPARINFGAGMDQSKGTSDSVYGYKIEGREIGELMAPTGMDMNKEPLLYDKIGDVTI